MRKSYDTVTEAMNDLRIRGYIFDLSEITERKGNLEKVPQIELSPEFYKIDETYRFEGYTDPGDEMIVYAISSKNRLIKGVVINGYGMYADSATSKIVHRLTNEILNR